MAASSEHCSRLLSVHDYGPKRFKWLTLKLLEWRDPTGRPRLWEMAERTTRPACGVDAVAIVARALSASAPPQIVLVSQYRPPIDAICYELPAGLIDPGEDAATAALRELEEETGLTPRRLISVTPVCVSDPGLTNANMQLAMVEVDLDAPYNSSAQQRLDDGEAIEVHLAPWDGLLTWLMARKSETGAHIDARLMSFAAGLQFTASGGGLGAGDGEGVSAWAAAGGVAPARPGCSPKGLNGYHRLRTESFASSSSFSKAASKAYTAPLHERLGLGGRAGGGGAERSYSACTDVLPAMNSLQLEQAARAYGDAVAAAREDSARSAASLSLSLSSTGEETASDSTTTLASDLSARMND